MMNIGGRVYAHMFLYQNQISNLAFGCHTLIKSLKFRILNLGNFENFEILVKENLIIRNSMTSS